MNMKGDREREREIRRKTETGKRKEGRCRERLIKVKWGKE